MAEDLRLAKGSRQFVIDFFIFVAYNEGVKEKIRLNLTLEKSRYSE